MFAYLFTWHALYVLKDEHKVFAEMREQYLTTGDPDFASQTRYTSKVCVCVCCLVLFVCLLCPCGLRDEEAGVVFIFCSRLSASTALGAPLELLSYSYTHGYVDRNGRCSRKKNSQPESSPCLGPANRSRRPRSTICEFQCRVQRVGILQYEACAFSLSPFLSRCLLRFLPR